MLQKAFCNDAMSTTEMLECSSHFRNGQTLVEDFEFSGHPPSN
jgi:hypothetical protein